MKFKSEYYLRINIGNLTIPLWFPKKWLIVFFNLKKQLASQNMFLKKSELSITTYLFLVFYRSTTLQSQLFLKILTTFCVSRNKWIILLFLQSNSFTNRIVSQKYQDLLQRNSHDCFSKISRTFYASRKSWIIVIFLLCTLKEKLPIFLINTLLLHIPLLALTDRQNYRETNTLAVRGLEELFLQLCCCVSFWFWWGIGFGFTYLCT